jgi:quercetin dioxygenase-like cupin family protein
MPEVISFDDIRLSSTTCKFEGGDRAALSFFHTVYGRGQGPDQHTHPYSEVFIVEAGEAEFLVGGETRRVGAGHVVIVPPETAHGFKNPHDDRLHVVGIHPSPHVVQTDL